MKIPKLSFCISCMNRFHQIRKTLPENLRDNKRFQNLIEFILVDFNSFDGLQDWVLENFPSELSSGYLKYYYTEELSAWHASIAKNTAHLLANHDILVNLDCDNYTGYYGGHLIISQFLKFGEGIFIHQYGGDPLDGSYGRISVMRNYFHFAGGYDESFEPMAYQDTDLIIRLTGLNLKCLLISDQRYNMAVRNSKEEGILYTDSNLGWKEMMQKNIALSRKNREEGNITVNNGLWGIRHNLYDHSGKPVIL